PLSYYRTFSPSSFFSSRYSHHLYLPLFPYTTLFRSLLGDSQSHLVFGEYASRRVPSFTDTAPRGMRGCPTCPQTGSTLIGVIRTIPSPFAQSDCEPCRLRRHPTSLHTDARSQLCVLLAAATRFVDWILRGVDL